MKDPPVSCINYRYMIGSSRMWEMVWYGRLRLTLTCSTSDSKQNCLLERSLPDNIYGNDLFSNTTTYWLFTITVFGRNYPIVLLDNMY